jgi:PAS domain S-box-containing protein
LTLLSFVSVFSAAFALAIGVVAVSQESKTAVQRIFFVLSLVISFSAFAEFGFRQAVRMDDARFWLDLGKVTPLIIPLIVGFTGAYTRIFPIARSWFRALLLFLPAVAFILLDFATGQLSGNPVKTGWGWSRQQVTSLGFHAYSVWAGLLLVGAAVMAIRYYRTRKNRRERSQAKYVALAISLVVFVTIVIDIGTSYLKIELPEFATLAYALANSIIAFAIRRHRLFVINPVVASGTILETISDALFLVTPAGTVAHVNKAAGELFGCGEQELVGKHLEELVLTDAKLLQPLPEGGSAITSPFSDVPAVARFSVADREILLSVAGRTMHDTQTGEVLGSVITLRDISQRVNAEIALRESYDLLEERVRLRTEELRRANEQLADERERLAITLKSIGDGVITANSYGSITFLNYTAEQVTGWKSAQAVGRPIGEVLRIYGSEDLTEPLDPAGESLRTGIGTELSSSACLLTASGERRRIDDSAAPIRNNEGITVGVVVVFRDVTQKERMEEELFRAKKLESVAVLAGGIAHDFNNLLTGIGNNLFMCKMAAPDNTEVAFVVNEAERELLRAQRLAVQLLTFAQGGEPVLSVCSPRTIIEESIGFLMSGSHCSYDLRFDPDLMNVVSDKGMIEQVLGNLVINAEQAMPQGGTIVITADNVQVGTDRFDSGKGIPVHLEHGVYVRVGVYDNGSGIAPEIKERIFDPFFTTKGKGRGLGLSIVSSIVKKHGGMVCIEPGLEQGAGFLVYLPAVDASAPEQVDASDRHLPVSEEAGGGRILLMDDDDSICRSTSKILEMSGYSVVTASNGEEAIALYRDAFESGWPFDLVILDLTIPGGMGGGECIRHLRELDPAVVAVVSSGYSTDAVMAHFSDYGFRGVLRKPYSIDKLHACLRAVLG